MIRNFDIGDRIVCTVTGVVGQCTEFYKPTACEEQTMVLTDSKRKYHAPTTEWIKADEHVGSGFEFIRGYEIESDGEVSNPYGEYVYQFAKNHSISIDDTHKHPMVKARLESFRETGK